MKAPRILHYPGSKWSMVDWIIGNMPDHQTYLEPYFGSGAVFFNKEPADLETINDLDGDIVNLFRVIRECPEELAKLVHWTPYSREEYYASYETGGENWNRQEGFWFGVGWQEEPEVQAEMVGDISLTTTDQGPLNNGTMFQKRFCQLRTG